MAVLIICPLGYFPLLSRTSKTPYPSSTILELCHFNPIFVLVLVLVLALVLVLTRQTQDKPYANHKDNRMPTTRQPQDKTRPTTRQPHATTTTTKHQSLRSFLFLNCNFETFDARPNLNPNPNPNFNPNFNPNCNPNLNP